MKIFVANFDKDTDEYDLRDLFRPYGTVTNVCLLRDRETKEPLGYGFVSMPHYREAERAIMDLDGYWWRNGRRLKVGESRPRDRR